MNKQMTDELLAFEADHLWVNENLETLLTVYRPVDRGQARKVKRDILNILS